MFYTKFAVHDDDEHYIEAVSKGIYVHDEDGLFYKYRYAIRVMRTEDNIVGLYMFMVPVWESLCDRVKNKIYRWSGYTDLSSYKEDELPEFSCAEYMDDYGVIFKYQAFENLLDEDDWERLSSYDKVMEFLDTTASKLDKYEGLYGFYMDCPQDRLGITGWDVVKHVVNDGPTPYDAAMNRFRQALL